MSSTTKNPSVGIELEKHSARPSTNTADTSRESVDEEDPEEEVEEKEDEEEEAEEEEKQLGRLPEKTRLESTNWKLIESLYWEGKGVSYICSKCGKEGYGVRYECDAERSHFAHPPCLGIDVSGIDPNLWMMKNGGRSDERCFELSQKQVKWIRTMELRSIHVMAHMYMKM